MLVPGHAFTPFDAARVPPRLAILGAMRQVAVFCGSSTGAHPVYAESAHALGAALAQRGVGVVYGGAHVGLMGIVADAALAHGGHVTGVIPASMVDRELAHRGLPDLRIVETMHQRKALMASLADAFVVLPGGMGTLDEMCEIFTWAQLGLHAKPCALLNVRGYWDPFLTLLDRAVEEGFLRAPWRSLVLHAPDVASLLACLTAAAVPAD